MARIPDAEIAQLKQRVALAPLVEAFGVVLKRQGADLIGHCPFHDDRTPSLVISPENNLWHCLGVCQTGGSVIDWVMKAQGLSFRQAVEILKTNTPALAAGSSTNTGAAPPKRTTVPQWPLLERTDDDQALLNRVIERYHQAFTQSPRGVAFLTRRGLNDTEALAAFQLGIADRTLGYQLPSANCKDGAALRGQLQRLGILRPSGHELFHGSLVFPVFDAEGNVVEVYGRKLQDHQRHGVPLHLYLPGPHRGVWNRAGLQDSNEVILCEALLDALSFWCAGFHHVTASYGVGGFTDDHLALFQELAIKRVLIAYDPDSAGDRAANTLAVQLAEAGLSSARVGLPPQRDANDVYQATGKAGLERALAQLTPLPVANTVSVPVSVEVAPSSASPSVSAPPPPTTIPTPTISPPAAAKPVVTPTESATTAALVASLPPPDTADTLPAAPTAAPPPLLTPTAQGDYLAQFGQRYYRIRGFAPNTSHNQLRVNLRVHADQSLHVDTLDLYAAKPRMQFIQQAAVELGVPAELIKRDLAQLLLALETLQAQHIEQTLNPQSPVPALSDAARRQALDYLRRPELLARLLADLDRCGIVGEAVNKQIAYLACLSRKLERPLAILVQSASAAGKSSLMDAILALMPEEDRLQYSAMTGQSLYYLNGRDLKHKILAIVEEQGASKASYALKLLQSEGELTIASTGKDPHTGQLVTQEYRIEGPIMLFSTTTAVQLDEELVNRCLILGVDESREQTQAIHAQQRRRRTLDGLLAQHDKDRLLTLHRNLQRLLRPLAVVNPYAEQLSFLDDRTRLRRDHEKYLTLIDAVALLHQYQRPVKTVNHAGQTLAYIEVTPADVALANRLAHEVLGRSLDELSPQTRRLLQLLHQYVSERSQAENLDKAFVRFSRRQLRDYTGWSDFQVKTHLRKLTALEYVLAHQGGRGQRFVYELLYDGEGQQGQRFVMGLTDSAALENPTAGPPPAPADHNPEPVKPDLEHRNSNLEESRRPQSAPKEWAGSPRQTPKKPCKNGLLANTQPKSAETARLGTKTPPPLQHTSPPTPAPRRSAWLIRPPPTLDPGWPIQPAASIRCLTITV